MIVVSKQNKLCSFQNKEADYLYVDFRLELSIMSRTLDVRNTAKGGVQNDTFGRGIKLT